MPRTRAWRKARRAASVAPGFMRRRHGKRGRVTCPLRTRVAMATDVDSLLARIKGVVATHLAPYPVKVYLCDSHATGKANEHSDVDVAVDPRGSLPSGVLARRREALEGSTIPCRVDIVDLNDAGADFRDRVLKEGAEWSVSSNG